MKFGRSNPQPEEIEPNGIYYCSTCGSIVNSVIRVNQVVLVKLPGKRFFFGKVIKFREGQVQVAINKQENVLVDPKYIEVD